MKETERTQIKKDNPSSKIAIILYFLVPILLHFIYNPASNTAVTKILSEANIEDFETLHQLE